MMTCLSSTNDMKPRYFLKWKQYACLTMRVPQEPLDLITFVSQTPSNAPHFKLLYFKNVGSDVIFIKDHDMHNASYPLDYLTNTF